MCTNVSSNGIEVLSSSGPYIQKQSAALLPTYASLLENAPSKVISEGSEEMSLTSVFTALITFITLLVGMFFFRKHKARSTRREGGLSSKGSSNSLNSTSAIQNLYEDSPLKGSICYICKKSFGFVGNRRHNCGNCR
jgi:hypothetical protein